MSHIKPLNTRKRRSIIRPSAQHLTLPLVEHPAFRFRTYGAYQPSTPSDEFEETSLLSSKSQYLSIPPTIQLRSAARTPLTGKSTASAYSQDSWNGDSARDKFRVDTRRFALALDAGMLDISSPNVISPESSGTVILNNQRLSKFGDSAIIPRIGTVHKGVRTRSSPLRVNRVTSASSLRNFLSRISLASTTRKPSKYVPLKHHTVRPLGTLMVGTSLPSPSPFGYISANKDVCSSQQQSTACSEVESPPFSPTYTSYRLDRPTIAHSPRVRRRVPSSPPTPYPRVALKIEISKPCPVPSLPSVVISPLSVNFKELDLLSSKSVRCITRSSSMTSTESWTGTETHWDTIGVAL
ncbi:hypothetical protein AMATHDRAFT_5123 [Amanita thiersii Skay4041]|uniref:Uncharacterized protein n=1 Tax=Amanita thiersii Skay4041 TaxID=703135 RepID=A0A2A9NN46_9AGAR|nr:hypothetical protein AMATHDRAFT_5123 [Amanita thiersii Skay4041]